MTVLSVLLLTSAVTSLQAASTIQLSGAIFNVTEGMPEASVIVQRTNDLDKVVSVDFATTPGSATAGLDYVDVATTLTFEAGVTDRSVAIPILNDGLSEGVETVRVSLSNPGGDAVLGVRTNATVRIADNDKGLQLEVANCSVNEDAGAVTVRVLRGDDGDLPASVDYATANVTALAAADYVAATGTLTFAPGETLKQITVGLVNDSVRELTEAFRIALSNPCSGASLGTPTEATVTITDTDELVQFQAASCTSWEDAAIVRLAVVRGESAVAGTVDVTTTDQQAISGQDYLGMTTTLAFAAGERIKLIEISLINDGQAEPTERFGVSLSNPTGGLMMGSRRAATVRILDNDPGFGFGFERDFVSVWQKLPAVTLNVIRGNDTWLEPLTVDYQTVDGAARAGVNYQAASGTLSFAANERVKSLSIDIIQSAEAQGSKSFMVALTNLTGQIPMGRSTMRVTIVPASLGIVDTVEPTVRGAIEGDGGLVEVSWQEPAALSRADSVTGPWEELGAIDSPLVARPDSPGKFYQFRSARPAQVYVPSVYDSQTPLPLVVLLHGWGGDGAMIEGAYRLRPFAESRGFLLCYPDGTLDSHGYRFWNATDGCCNFDGAAVDDSAYLRSLIEAIAQRFAVDRKRIYCTGFSNGGFMSHRLACDHADLIAGIAPCAGVTFLDPSGHRPSEPVNVLHMHGTVDDVVPYGGGSLGGALFPGAVQTVQMWADFNGCQGPVWDDHCSMDLVVDVPGLDTTVMRYTNAPPGGAVELWTIHGVGHSFQASEFQEKFIDWLLAHPKP